MGVKSKVHLETLTKTVSEQHLADILIAVEYGYRAHERGDGLMSTLQNAVKIVTSKRGDE